MTEPPQDQKDRIREQLRRILSSAAFAGSERHRQFLSFVVEQALKGDTDKLNEFVLGFEVFNKSESFDPRIDSIVRVEARRLRERLKKYYEDEGRDDAIVITLRPRSFVPHFSEPSSPAPSKLQATGTPAEAAAGETPAPGWLRRWLPSHKTIAVAVVGLLCGAIGTVIALSVRSKRPAPPQTASIIVLPFQTLAPATDPELGNAIADSIITALAGGPGLRVISRGSAIQFNESGASRYQLAADLHVDYIVEGTVRTRDNRVAVSAKLTDVRTQSYLWAETRESDMGALEDLERDLINGMISRIRLPAPPPLEGAGRVPRRRAATPQAYGAFLKGQYYWYQADRGNVEKSIALFEEALRGDPNYSPAWAWLSQGYLLQIFIQDGRDAAIIAKGRQAAAKALGLDENLAEAHAAVASYAALDWNWEEADREFRRAIGINPEWAQGHLMYSIMYLVPNGRLREALGEAFRAHDLDPLTRITRSMLAQVLYLNRDYARAIAESEDLHKSSSGPPLGDPSYLLSLALSGKAKRALADVQPLISSAGGDPRSLSLYGYLAAKTGLRNEAESVLRRLTERSRSAYVPPISLAFVSIGLGDKGEALRHLRTAVANHVPEAPQIGSDPVFEPLHGDSSYEQLIRQMGLSPAN